MLMASYFEDCACYSLLFWCVGHHSFEFSFLTILSFCVEVFPVRRSSARNEDEETHELYIEGCIER